jgi:hypothetical protein
MDTSNAAIEIVPTSNGDNHPRDMMLEIIPTSNVENHHPRKMMLRAVAFTLALTVVVGAVALISDTESSTEGIASSTDWIVLDIGNDRCMDGWLYSVESTGNEECRQKCDEDARCSIYNVWNSGWCQGHSACESTSPDDENPSILIKTYQRRESIANGPEYAKRDAAENSCDAYMARSDDG